MRATGYGGYSGDDTTAGSHTPPFRMAVCETTGGGRGGEGEVKICSHATRSGDGNGARNDVDSLHPLLPPA